MARYSPSDCDWLTQAARIAERLGELALAAALRALVARLTGEGHPREPQNVCGVEGQGAAQDQPGLSPEGV